MRVRRSRPLVSTTMASAYGRIGSVTCRRTTVALSGSGQRRLSKRRGDRARSADDCARSGWQRTREALKDTGKAETEPTPLW